jgi:hypothetical protein
MEVNPYPLIKLIINFFTAFAGKLRGETTKG